MAEKEVSTRGHTGRGSSSAVGLCMARAHESHTWRGAHWRLSTLVPYLDLAAVEPRERLGPERVAHTILPAHVLAAQGHGRHATHIRSTSCREKKREREREEEKEKREKGDHRAGGKRRAGARTPANHASSTPAAPARGSGCC